MHVNVPVEHPTTFQPCPKWVKAEKGNKIKGIMEHDELVGDMPRVEKLPTQERLKLAKKRRNEQLKKGVEYDKAYESVDSCQFSMGQTIFKFMFRWRAHFFACS